MVTLKWHPPLHNDSNMGKHTMVHMHTLSDAYIHIYAHARTLTHTKKHTDTYIYTTATITTTHSPKLVGLGPLTYRYCMGGGGGGGDRERERVHTKFAPKLSHLGVTLLNNIIMMIMLTPLHCLRCYSQWDLVFKTHLHSTAFTFRARHVLLLRTLTRYPSNWGRVSVAHAH